MGTAACMVCNPVLEQLAKNQEFTAS